MDTWLLLYPYALGKSTHDNCSLSSLRILVCSVYRFWQLRDMLSTWATEKCAQQRFNQMGLTNRSYCFDILLELLPWSHNMLLRYSCFIVLLPYIGDSEGTMLLVCITVYFRQLERQNQIAQKREREEDNSLIFSELSFIQVLKVPTKAQAAHKRRISRARPARNYTSIRRAQAVLQ